MTNQMRFDRNHFRREGWAFLSRSQKRESPARVSMKKKESMTGIKIQTFNYIMILIALVLYAVLLYETVQVFNRYNILIDATEDQNRCQELATQVMNGSDILTDQVRLFVVTGDPLYANNYFKEAYVDRRRDLALEEMKQYHSNDNIYKYLQDALNYSNELMEREIYAMTMTAKAYECLEDIPYLSDKTLKFVDQDKSREELSQLAIQMVFDSGYRDAKALIQNNVNYSTRYTLEMTSYRQQYSQEMLSETINAQRICMTLLFIMNIIIFFFVSILIIRPLKIYIKCIKDNRTLEIIGSYEFKYLALTYNSIYELNASNEDMLRKQAEHDALTGLLNRASFEHLQQVLRSCGTPMAFLIIDVDNFKSINDGYGHAVGDATLKRVADLLTETFRNTDLVARIGGDEFCVIMGNVTEEQIRGVITKKVEGLNLTLLNGTEELPPVSLSVGVAFSLDGFDDTLYRRADVALYETKERGRRGCSFSTEKPPEPKT